MGQRQNAAPTGAGTVRCLSLAGSPDTVAERMGEAMDAIGGDGFLIGTPFQRIGRRCITEVCEGLVPAINVHTATAARHAA
jgi:alkanesulfonate monooxygenase SsuD/methylene tetrahydromethanopterin reductase-like flavin-dependent oxidoreductase (luciferase family)